MAELSYQVAVANLVIATLLWICITAFGLIDAAHEMRKNGKAAKRHRRANNPVLVRQAEGDFRRSEWFCVGFFLSFLVGLFSASKLWIIGVPPTIDTSLWSAAVTYVLVVGMACFQRGKHADRRTSIEINRLITERKRDG